MADQTSDVVGGISGQGLGALTGALQGGVNSLISAGSGFLDKWFPPDRREELKSKLTQFATERPALAGFILSNLAISGIPLFLFFAMTLTVFVFSLIGALLVGVLGALLFTAAAVGVALIILLPTLFITTFAASFVFLWGVGAYYIVKWFNQKEVPGIHSDLTNGLSGEAGLGKTLGGVPGMNRDLHSPQASEKKDESAQKKQAPTSMADKKDVAETIRERNTQGADGGAVGDLQK